MHRKPAPVSPKVFLWLDGHTVCCFNVYPNFTGLN